jgi:hypothetical protein
MAVDLMRGGGLDEETRQMILQRGHRTDRDRLFQRRRDVIGAGIAEQAVEDHGEAGAASMLDPGRVSEQEGRLLAGAATGDPARRWNMPGTVQDLATTSGVKTKSHVSSPSFAVQTASELETQRAQQEAQTLDLELWNRARMQFNQAQDAARNKQAGWASGRMTRVKIAKEMGKRGSSLFKDGLTYGLDAVERFANQQPLSADEYDNAVAILKQVDEPSRGVSALSRGEKAAVFAAERTLQAGLAKVQAAVAKRPDMPAAEWTQLLDATFTDPVTQEKGRVVAAQMMPKTILEEAKLDRGEARREKTLDRDEAREESRLDRGEARREKTLDRDEARVDRAKDKARRRLQSNVDRLNRHAFGLYLQEEGFSPSEVAELSKHLHNDERAKAFYEQFLHEEVPGTWYVGPDDAARVHARPKKSEHQPWEIAASSMASQRVSGKSYRPTMRDPAGVAALGEGGITKRDVEFYDYDAEAEMAESKPTPDGLVPGPGILSWKVGGQSKVIDKAVELFDSGIEYEKAIKDAADWGRKEGHLDADLVTYGQYWNVRDTVIEGMRARKSVRLKSAREAIVQEKMVVQQTLDAALVTYDSRGKLSVNANTFPHRSEGEKRDLITEYGLFMDDGTVNQERLTIHVDAQGKTQLGAVELDMLDTLARGSGVTLDSPAGRLIAGYVTSMPKSQWPETLRMVHQKTFNDFKAGAISINHDIEEKKRDISLERRTLALKLGLDESGGNNWLNEDGLAKVKLSSGKDVWAANPLVGEMLSRIQHLDPILERKMTQNLAASEKNGVKGADFAAFWDAFKGMVKPSWKKTVGRNGENLGAVLTQPLSEILKHDFRDPHGAMETNFGSAQHDVKLMYWNSENPLITAWAERRSEDLRKVMTGLDHPQAWEQMQVVAGKLLQQHGKTDAKTLEDLAAGTPAAFLAGAVGGDPVAAELYQDGKYMQALELAYIRTYASRAETISELSRDSMLALGEALSTVDGLEVLLGDVSVGRVEELGGYISDALDNATLEEFEAFESALGVLDAAFAMMKTEVAGLTSDLGIDKEYAQSLSLDKGLGYSSFAQFAELKKVFDKETGGRLEAAEDQSGMRMSPGIPALRYKPRKGRVLEAQQQRELRLSRESVARAQRLTSRDRGGR